MEGNKLSSNKSIRFFLPCGGCETDWMQARWGTPRGKSDPVKLHERAWLGLRKSSPWGVKGEDKHYCNKGLRKVGGQPIWLEEGGISILHGKSQQAWSERKISHTVSRHAIRTCWMNESVKQADLPQATHRTQAKQLEVTAGFIPPTPPQAGLVFLGEEKEYMVGSLTSIGSEGFSWPTPGMELGKADGGMSQAELFVCSSGQGHARVNKYTGASVAAAWSNRSACLFWRFELGSKWLSGPPFPEVKTSRQQLGSSPGQPGALPNNTVYTWSSCHQAILKFITCNGHANLPPTACGMSS